MSQTASISELTRNFGIIIAFLLPGFIVLWPMQYHSVTVATWLGALSQTDPDVGSGPTAGGFFFALLASLALGMLISALRWAMLDRMLHFRIPRPQLDYSRLQTRLAAFDYVNEHHYRYYQYYANSAVAVLMAGIMLFFAGAPERGRLIISVVVILAIVVVLLLAARDSLKKTVKKLAGVLRPGGEGRGGDSN